MTSLPSLFFALNLMLGSIMLPDHDYGGGDYSNDNSNLGDDVDNDDNNGDEDNDRN